MKKLICLLFTITAFTVHAASPLFHAVIAEKWLDAFENYNDDEKRAFMLGTLFPDIRYLAKIDRKSTHESGLSIDEILKTQSPFIKGMRVHTFVDDTRVKFLKNCDLMQHFDSVQGDKILFLKFLEDDILYSMREETASQYICEYLECIEPEELNYTTLEIVRVWHSHNIFYLSMGPSNAFTLLIAAGKTFGGISEKKTIECHNFILQFRDDEKARKYVADILKEFDNLFLNHL